MPDGDRSRFRFHAEQAPINNIQRDLDVVMLAFRTRRRPNLAIYDGNGVRQGTCKEARSPRLQQSVRVAPEPP